VGWYPTTGPQAATLTPNGRVEGLEDPDGKHGVSGMRLSGRIV